MVWATIALMPVMFWIGYYTAGVPYGLLLAFATIGFIGGMTLRPHIRRGNLWLLANTPGFSLGLGVTSTATYPMADELMGAMSGGLIRHTIL